MGQKYFGAEGIDLRSRMAHANNPERMSESVAPSDLQPATSEARNAKLDSSETSGPMSDSHLSTSDNREKFSPGLGKSLGRA